MKDTQNTTLPQETRSAAQPQDGQPENGKKTEKTPPAYPRGHGKERSKPLI